MPRYRTILLIPTLLALFAITRVLPNVYAAEIGQYLDPTPPIANYSKEVQSAAQQLVSKSWLVKRRFKKVHDRLGYWQKLAYQCDDLSDEMEVSFNGRACRNFARSQSDGRASFYQQNCDALENWQSETESTLKQSLRQDDQLNASLRFATEVALEQLNYEFESVCGDWSQGQLSKEYEHIIELLVVGERPAGMYVMQQMYGIDARPGSWSGDLIGISDPGPKFFIPRDPPPPNPENENRIR